MKSSSIKRAIFYSILVTILYIISYQFYDREIVRGNIEDIAFDIVDKFAIETKDTNTTDIPNVMIFAIDDLYMKKNKLFDKHNRVSYGYLFPRDHIAKFIKNLDELVSEADPKNRPKALFIDYDLSFSSMPYGKELSKEDIELLNTLKQDRNYTIFLPKTSAYNFVQYSKDSKIQELIKNKKIVFVSVNLLKSSDDTVRRYESYHSYLEPNDINKTYINVDIMLYNLIKQNKIPTIQEVKSLFKKDDIIANRIWIKSYKSMQTDDECISYKSYWQHLVKYSANCSLYEIDEDDFKDAVIMLGGTHSKNNDVFNTLNVLDAQSFTGIDLHANTLMTILHLNGQLKPISLFVGSIIMFATFFTISILVDTLLGRFNLDSSISFIVTLAINGVILITISTILLTKHHIWFNWLVPLILFEAIEAIDFIQDYTPKIIEKIKNKRNKK